MVEELESKGPGSRPQSGILGSEILGSEILHGGHQAMVTVKYNSPNLERTWDVNGSAYLGVMMSFFAYLLAQVGLHQELKIAEPKW